MQVSFYLETVYIVRGTARGQLQRAEIVGTVLMEV